MGEAKSEHLSGLRDYNLGRKRTFVPRSGTRAANNFRAPRSSEASSPTLSRSRSHASPHIFASKPSLITVIFPQLSHPAGTRMRSRSKILGLCWNGNGLRIGAV